MSNEVLFQRGGGGGNQSSMWDDTEMIAAWNQQLAMNDKKKKEDEENEKSGGGDATMQQPMQLNLPKQTQQSEEPLDGDDSPVAPYVPPQQQQGNGTGVMPPFPESAGPELRNMLQAWYAAGYWAGKYDSSHRK